MAGGRRWRTGQDEEGEGGGRGAGPADGRRARRVAAAHRAPLLAVPRRRPGRLPARAGDLHGARRPARPDVGGGLAARRRQARGAGDPPRRARAASRPTRSISTARGALAADARRAPGDVRSRRSRRRGAAAAQAPGGARAVAAGAGPQLQRDQRADRLVVHEGQPLSHRGPAQLPVALRDDRVGRRVRALAAGPLGDRRRRGDERADLELRPHLRNCPGCRATLKTLQDSAEPLAARAAGPAGRRRWAARTS